MADEIYSRIRIKCRSASFNLAYEVASLIFKLRFENLEI